MYPLPFNALLGIFYIFKVKLIDKKRNMYVWEHQKVSGFATLLFLIFCLNEMLVPHFCFFFLSHFFTLPNEKVGMTLKSILLSLDCPFFFIYIQRLVFHRKMRDSPSWCCLLGYSVEIQLPQFSFCRLFASIRFVRFASTRVETRRFAVNVWKANKKSQ